MALASSKTQLAKAQHIARSAAGDEYVLRHAGLLSMHAITQDLMHQIRVLQTAGSGGNGGQVNQAPADLSGSLAAADAPAGAAAFLHSVGLPLNLPIQTVIMDEAACSTDWSLPVLLSFHPFNLVRSAPFLYVYTWCHTHGVSGKWQVALRTTLWQAVSELSSVRCDAPLCLAPGSRRVDCHSRILHKSCSAGLQAKPAAGLARRALMHAGTSN